MVTSVGGTIGHAGRSTLEQTRDGVGRTRPRALGASRSDFESERQAAGSVAPHVNPEPDQPVVIRPRRGREGSVALAPLPVQRADGQIRIERMGSKAVGFVDDPLVDEDDLEPVGQHLAFGLLDEVRPHRLPSAGSS